MTGVVCVSRGVTVEPQGSPTAGAGTGAAPQESAEAAGGAGGGGTPHGSVEAAAEVGAAAQGYDAFGTGVIAVLQGSDVGGGKAGAGAPTNASTGAPPHAVLVEGDSAAGG